MVSYHDVANVLDAVAQYVDEIETQKLASINEAKTTRVNKLAESYENSTGEKLETTLQQKLAQLDPEVLDHLLKVANNNSNGNPESLGGPAEVIASGPPRTIKEAADHAEDRFLSWIIG